MEIPEIWNLTILKSCVCRQLLCLSADKYDCMRHVLVGIHASLYPDMPVHIYMSQAWKSGFGIDEPVHVQLLELSEIVGGDTGRCAGELAWLYCTCTRFFLLEEESRWLWCHLVMFLLLWLCKGLEVYIRGVCTSSRLIIWVILAAVPPSYLLKSHQPSVTATLVPLEECKYNLAGKCSSFVQLHVPQVILGTLSWFDLVVCMLTG